MISLTLPKIQQQYEQDGFLLHTEPVLDAELLDRAVRGCEAIRNGEFDTGELPDGAYRLGANEISGHSTPDALRWLRANPNALTKVEQPQIASTALREAIASPLLERLAAEIAGAQGVQVWWVQLLHKPSADPGSARTTIGWHQDRRYWGDWREDSETFTAWLAHSDVTVDAGPMIFVPGSHRWGLLDPAQFS